MIQSDFSDTKGAESPTDSADEAILKATPIFGIVLMAAHQVAALVFKEHLSQGDPPPSGNPVRQSVKTRARSSILPWLCHQD
jgi:hypothetical protein